MDITELMQDRYKNILDFPYNPAPFGLIYQNVDKMQAEFFDKWPTHYRKLHWGEERPPEDMPVFLKRPYINSDKMEVVKVDAYVGNGGGFRTIDNRVAYLTWFTPATEEEYFKFLESK